MPHHSARYLGLAACLWSLGACDALETLPRDQCGNSVIERGEDCDGAGLGSNVCNGSCRLQCSPEGACPEGWGCGVDDLCRQPSGAFGAFGSALAISADRLTLADFDGDGRSDLLATRGSSLSIAYSDGTSLLPQANVIAFTPIDDHPDVPSAGDLDGDGRADLAVRLGRGLGVLRGERDRTLLAQAYSRALPAAIEDGAVVFAADIDLRPEAPGSEILALGATSLVLVYSANLGDLPTKPLYTWPAGHGPVAGEVLTGNLNTSSLLDGVAVVSPQHEIVFAFQGDSQLTVFEPLLQDAAGKATWNYGGETRAPAVIALPAGVTIEKGVSSGRANWNNFGAPDLFIATKNQGADALHVTFALANGLFHSAPFSSVPPMPDGLAAPFTRNGPGAGIALAPLAVGLVNTDNLPDFVTSGGIFVSQCNPLQSCIIQQVDPLDPAAGVTANYVSIAAPDSPSGWTSALFVGQGLSSFSSGFGDVLTTSSDASFTLFNNVSGNYLNAFLIPTQSPVEHLALGDFDGDGVRDLLFSQISKRSIGEEPALESLHISFGDALGLPTPPVDLGDLGQVERVTPAQLLRQGAPLDSITDFLVRAKTGDVTAGYIFTGSTDRQVQSPLDLPDACAGDNAPAGVPRYSAIAQLDGEEAREIAVLYRQENAAGGSYALWGVDARSTVSSEICDTLIGPGELPDLGDEAVTMLPVDLDGDGKDEVLLLPERASTLYVARAGADKTWEIETLTLDSPHVGLIAAALSEPAPGVETTPDVILWSIAGITVLRNDGKGLLDAEKAIEIPILGEPCPVRTGDAKAESPTGVAALHTSAAGSRALAVITPGDSFLIQLDNDEEGLFGPAVCVSDTFGGGGDAITAGDVDGDGVEDLVIARPGGIQALAGIPVVQ